MILRQFSVNIWTIESFFNKNVNETRLLLNIISFFFHTFSLKRNQQFRLVSDLFMKTATNILLRINSFIDFFNIEKSIFSHYFNKKFYKKNFHKKKCVIQMRGYTMAELIYDMVQIFFIWFDHQWKPNWTLWTLRDCPSYGNER